MAIRVVRQLGQGCSHLAEGAGEDRVWMAFREGGADVHAKEEEEEGAADDAPELQAAAAAAALLVGLYHALQGPLGAAACLAPVPAT